MKTMPLRKQPVYIGRFAPSPSGPLHFGSLVAAMGSYLDARTHQGQWLLRMEDLDPPREKPGAADDILRTLEAFGFQWDASILYQSTRTLAYQEAVDALIQAGHAYPCTCSRKQIAESGLIGIEGHIYPGTCRNRPAPTRQRFAIRFNTESHTVTFIDRIHGHLTQHIESEMGDFIIKRIDGLFAYQLAVVVDDAYQGITHVVRGADLLHSTPRQIMLQQRLHLETPSYAHLPLVMDENGKKLSKQTQAHRVDKKKPLPELIAAFEFLGQQLDREKPGSVAEFWEFARENWQIDKIR